MGRGYVAFATIRKHIHLLTQHQMHIRFECVILLILLVRLFGHNLIFSEAIFKNYMTKVKSSTR